jgi:hypothetical protein
MPRPRKKHYTALTIKEAMRLSKKEVRKRAGLARGSAQIAAPASPVETGKLGADDLKRWRKPEKPVEIIG